jgi:hypothetical protein
MSNKCFKSPVETNRTVRIEASSFQRNKAHWMLA